MTVILGAAALVAWVGFEIVFRAPGEAGSLKREASDRASTPLLIAAFVLATILPILLKNSSFGSLGDAAWAGVALSAGGLVIRGWGMRTLGTAYSRTLKTTADQRLVTVGPYRFVRHPGYLGSIAVWVGSSLAFHSWLAALIVALIMVAAYGWRIRAEERMLAERFGDDYSRYAASTAKLIPRIY